MERPCLSYERRCDDMLPQYWLAQASKPERPYSRPERMPHVLSAAWQMLHHKRPNLHQQSIAAITVIVLAGACKGLATWRELVASQAAFRPGRMDKAIGDTISSHAS